MKNLAIADALANVQVVNPSVVNKEKTPVKTKKHKTVAVVPDVIVAPTTMTITQAELKELLDAAAKAAANDAVSRILAAQPASVTPVQAGPRQATKPEACAAHKFLSVLAQGLSKVIVGTRDKVVVPANIYLVDKAIPDTLAVVAAGSVAVASGAANVTGFFTRLAEKAAAKSLALTVR